MSRGTNEIPFPGEMMNRNRLLDRFLQYVQIDTTAREGVDGYPSSPGQRKLGELVVRQLREIGVTDVNQNEHAIVLATIPGNRPAPVVAFNAHFDTSPETSGANVRPRVIEKYAGGDIPLEGDGKVITVEKCPELADLHGKTLVTTDGTTLLGGDDKAGVAIMMELASQLIENPDIPRGDVRLLFTCDEEIGRGAMHVDIEQVDATVAYTFDGGGQNKVEVETFSADLATVRFTGVNIHPAIARDKMINAIRAAGEFINALPRDLSPERTAGRDGFLHPYRVDGGVAEVTAKILLRSFDTPQLEVYAGMLRKIALGVEQNVPGVSIDVAVSRQYRNLGDGLKKEPRAVEYAMRAHERLGRKAVPGIIRGGTDGSQFTEMGLPTPNLSSGQHNIHSPLEFVCLDEMLAACEVGLEIVRLWGDDG